MNKRDKAILEAVERFRCLSRDNIAEMFFSHCKRPITNANNVLKRLRDRKYLTVAPYRQPYVYMIRPAPIKKDSNKIDHFLSIAEVYTKIRRAGKVKYFEVEPRFKADVRPDIFTMIGGTPFYIEVQNSIYSERVMNKKIERYQEFYLSNEWRVLPWQRKDKQFFPFVLIFSKNRYKIETKNIKVIQFKDINEFLNSISKKNSESANMR